MSDTTETEEEGDTDELVETDEESIDESEGIHKYNIIQAGLVPNAVFLKFSAKIWECRYHALLPCTSVNNNGTNIHM